MQNKTMCTINGKERYFNTYFDMVDYLAQNKINYEFPNGVIEHSTAIVQRFLQYCNGDFVINAVNFKKEIFDTQEIIKAVKDFLTRKNNRILVLVQDDSIVNKEREFIKSFQTEITEKRIEIKKNKYRTGKRFMVVGNAFREATNNENNDFCAWVNFNNPAISEKLFNQFLEDFDKAEIIHSLA